MKLSTHLIGLISSMTFSTGWVFGILHWPSATQLSVGGFLAFAFIYLPIISIDYFKATNQRPKFERLQFLVGFASGIIVGSSVILKALHVQGADHILIVGSLLFIFGFLPLLYITMYKKSIS